MEYKEQLITEYKSQISHLKNGRLTNFNLCKVRCNLVVLLGNNEIKFSIK